MAIKIPWKSLSKGDSVFSKWGPISTKWGTFSSKQIAFFAAAGLVVAAGLLLRSGLFSGEPEGEQKTPVTIEAPASPAGTAPAPSAATTPAPADPAPSATAPAATPAAPVAEPSPPAQEATTNEQADQPSEAAAPAAPAGEAEQAAQPELPDPGTILVAKRPVEVLSGPSATASVMYGFPAGRQFRVIGREGGFAQIKDVVSGASGWINEAALAPPPREPDIYTPSQPRPSGGARTAADPKPRAAKRDSTADSEAAAPPAEPRKRGGLFGGGGPFRGIFGGGD